MYTRRESRRKIHYVMISLCSIVAGAFIFACVDKPRGEENAMLQQTMANLNFNNRCLTEQEFDDVVCDIEMRVSALNLFCSTNIIKRSILINNIPMQPIVSKSHRDVAYLIARYAGEHVGVLFVVDSRDVVKRVVTFHGIE